MDFNYNKMRDPGRQPSNLFAQKLSKLIKSLPYSRDAS